MIIVDTSVWIDYFNGQDTLETATLDQALGSEVVAIGDLILVEILQGFSIRQRLFCRQKTPGLVTSI